MRFLVFIASLGSFAACGGSAEPFSNDRSDPLSVEALCADLGAYEDASFWVSGTLHARDYRCTAIGCEAVGLTCCNHCASTYTFDCDPTIPAYMQKRVVHLDMTDDVGPRRLVTAEGHPGGTSWPGQTSNGCVGDECGIQDCSHLAPGGDVLLHGRLTAIDRGLSGLDHRLKVDVIEAVTAPPMHYDPWSD